jgi:hypothetical protein
MFCAFNGPPNIVRLHGTGAVVVPEDDRFAALAAKFPSRPGIRAIIVVDVARVSETCGFAVPFMDYVGDRDLLDRSSAKKGPEKLAAYRVEKNSHSLDGLPGLDPPV